MLKCIILLVAIIVASSNGKHHSKLKTRPKHKTCDGSGCESASDYLLKYMDPKINPCDDFYQFACGKFLRNTKIPDGKDQVGTLYDLKTDVTKRLGDSIAKFRKRGKIRPFLLVKKLYKTCMDKKKREKDGTKALKKILTALGGWPVLQGNKFNEKRFDWTAIMFKLRKRGYPTDSLITVDIKQDPKNSNRAVITLDQASLGIPKGYFDMGADDIVVRYYYSSMVKAAMALGAREAVAAKDLENSFEFEKALANISLSSEKLANLTPIYNPTTLAKLQKKHPSVQWRKYITNILNIPGIKVANNEVLNILTPQYIKDLENLLQHTSKRYYYINYIIDYVKDEALNECRILANYIIWRVVWFSMPYLSERLSNVMLRLRMLQKGTLKKQQQQQRTTCTGHLSENMPLAIGSLYVRKLFSRSFIKPVSGMVSKIVSAFIKILNNAQWMDKTTKANALKKVKSMGIYVGYAHEILDDRKMEKYYFELNSDNYLLQMLNVSKFNADKGFGLLRRFVKKAEWSIRLSPATVNAYYSTGGNEMHILAAIMQAPVFSNDRPQYMNYGAIGSIIGHEITHGFDQSGALFNADGNLINWWSKSTKKAFQEKVQCIVDQYGNFTVPELGNMHLKGRLTANENIADHGGLLAAHKAYNLWAKNKDTRPSLNYTLNQMFWISYANLWCTKINQYPLKVQVLTDVHSPAEFRVLGSLRNSKEFSKDFNCPLGSKMNPTHKCPLW